LTVEILRGDALAVLRTLPAGTFQCAVTSPPYFGLRSYLPAGHPDKAREIGAEETPEAYVARLVEVFREVRRALRPDGVLWLNLGDTYAMNTRGRGGPSRSGAFHGTSAPDGKTVPGQALAQRRAAIPTGCKPKDLLLVPARVALALQADGWWLRSETVWAKPNPMPEPTKDRPTSAHEKLFLLAKSPRYFFDAGSIAEQCADPSRAGRMDGGMHRGAASVTLRHGVGRRFLRSTHRNARNVQHWTPRPYRGAHFAVMPPDMAAWCIRCASAPGDAVLDPFGGAGTTAFAAVRLGRRATSIDLDAGANALAAERLGLFAPPAPSPEAVAA